MADLYAKALPAYIEKGVEFELLDSKLKSYDTAKLGAALNHERDQQFTYLGLQTLYDRYFIHKDNVRFELPQIFFMRVAMGPAIEEEQKEARAIEFYNLLSSFDYMASTPTLFNAGTLRPQLSSCYLTTVPDDRAASTTPSATTPYCPNSPAAGQRLDPGTRAGRLHQGHQRQEPGRRAVPLKWSTTPPWRSTGGKRKGAVCAYTKPGTGHRGIPRAAQEHR